MRYSRIGLLFFLLLSFRLTATTWDEPWHEAVIAKAELFVKAKVISSDPLKGVQLDVISTLAGKTISGKITVNRFNMLSPGSISAREEMEFHFKGVDTCYFFLSAADSGYAMATPTTGFATMKNREVYATYRHSYHQALVPDSIYEASQRAMFLHAHGEPYDEAWVKSYIEKAVAAGPATPVGNNPDPDLFFTQHVALEMIYHLRLTGYSDRLKLFLETPFVHVQTSAVRALGRDATAKIILFDFLRSDQHADFAKVMAIWALRDLDARELKPQLKKFVKKASREEVGFGGNIMDPRVGTHFPNSVHDAAQDLLDHWQ